jgi:hypothetical protein
MLNEFTSLRSEATEAELEARARGALLKALPWLSGRAIKHQVRLSFQLGHAKIIVDGVVKERATGRADILMIVDDVNTAIVELKRPGLGVSQDDVEQALSYARILHPRPPLVLVTDSLALRIVATHTGLDWCPETCGQMGFAALISNALTSAGDDINQAVGRLMGSNPEIWTQAISAVSAVFLEERTGDWLEREMPFVEDYLLPRKASTKAFLALLEGQRLVILQGGPLSGKSNCLRELATLTNNSGLALLLLDADCGLDLFEAIADLLSAHLEWAVTADEAKHWLRVLSKADGPALIIGVDNFDGSRGQFRRDLETITSNVFGPRVRTVLAMDDWAARRLSYAENGRSASVLARRKPKALHILPLDDDEFAHAREVLFTHRATAMPGSFFSPELRQPWILRVVLAELLSGCAPLPAGSGVIIPSMPGIGVLRWVAQNDRFEAGPGACLREFAQAVLQEAEMADLPTQLKLQAMDAFLVRRVTLGSHLNPGEVTELVTAGLIREARADNGDCIYIAKLPELVASELVRIIAERLAAEADQAVGARWLVDKPVTLPLGHLIAAAAILEMISRAGGASGLIITSLLAIQPHLEEAPVGSRIVQRDPEYRSVELEVLTGSRLRVHVAGQSSFDLPYRAEGVRCIKDPHAWQVLSYLGGFPIAFDSEEGVTRVDAWILRHVGGHNLPLVDINNFGDHGLVLHEICGGEVVCHKMGIVEPITAALLAYIARDSEAARELVLQAVEDGSPFLLARIHAALDQAVTYTNIDAEGLEELLTDFVLPALRAAAPDVFAQPGHE